MDEVVAKPIDVELIKYILEDIIELWKSLSNFKAGVC